MSSSLMWRFPKLEHVNKLNILTPMVLEIPDFLKPPFFLGGYPWCGNLRFPYEDDYLDPFLPRRELLAGRQSWLGRQRRRPYEIHRSWKWTSSFWDMSRSPFLGEVHHTSPKKTCPGIASTPLDAPQRCLISPIFLGKNHLPKWFCRWTMVNFQRLTRKVPAAPRLWPPSLPISSCFWRSVWGDRWGGESLRVRKFVASLPIFLSVRCRRKHRDWGFLK